MTVTFNPVSASERRAAAIQTSKGGIQKKSADLYDKKWKGFKEFCMNPELQQSNGVLDPDGEDQPSADIVGKIVEYFHFRVLEEGCDPGEPINVRSALSSAYRRKFGREGRWSVDEDGKTKGSPTCSIAVNEAAAYYHREKKRKGSKRALPFRFRYMYTMWEHLRPLSESHMSSVYVMAASSVCFTVWARIDELTNLCMSDLQTNVQNEEGVPHHLLLMRHRKYERCPEGQMYALYKVDGEECSCAFSHLNKWLSAYKSMLHRDFLPSDPLFPRLSDSQKSLCFGERLVPAKFMTLINDVTRSCGIIPKNAFGEDMGSMTAHCFRRGGAQHRYITGKRRWPLEVVKWWGGGGGAQATV